MSPRSIGRSGALIAAIALIVAACGGGDSAETTDPQAATESASTTGAPNPAAEADPEPGADSDPPPAADSDRAVQEGDSVSVHYTGSLENGEVFQSSVGGATLDFVVGSGQTIPGFDAAVRGMKAGEIKTVTLPPEEAYGERNEALIVEISIEQVPEGVTEGQELVDGNGNRVVVIEVRDDVVVIDANPGLAGETLVFEIELVSIN